MRTASALSPMLAAFVLALVACRTSTDYTPQIPVAPGAGARMLWIESLGLSSAPPVLPPRGAGRATPAVSARDDAGEAGDARDPEPDVADSSDGGNFEDDGSAHDGAPR